MSRHSVAAVIFVSAFLVSLSLQVHGEEFTFDIDPDRSFLIASAFVKSVEAPTSPQGDGADFASYSGSITIDLDSLDGPSEIQFLSAEAIAGNSGEWLPAEEGGGEGDPGDVATANFGIVLDAGPAGILLGAFRETVLTIESEDLAVSGNTFESGQSFVTSQGFLDSNIISVVLGDSFGRDDTTGDTAVNVSSELGTIDSANGFATLTIPVDLDFLSDAEDGVDFFFDGQIVATFGTPPTDIPGDANGDGQVNAADLNILGLNWQQSGKTREEGDFNGDGIVNAADLNVVGLNWQTGAPAATPVPEPRSAILLFVTMVAIGSRFRR